MDDDPNPRQITRRNLFGGVALAMLLPQSLSAAEVAQRIDDLDPMALHTLIRGLALLRGLGDPVLDADSDALLDYIALRAPEAPFLVKL